MLLLCTGVSGGQRDCRCSNLAAMSAVAVQISRVLFLVGIVLVMIHVITGRSARVA
jgi:hypothetical protein